MSISLSLLSLLSTASLVSRDVKFVLMNSLASESEEVGVSVDAALVDVAGDEEGRMEEDESAEDDVLPRTAYLTCRCIRSFCCFSVRFCACSC